MTSDQPDLPLLSLYQPISREAVRAHAIFQSWEALFATTPKRVEILNLTASGFFVMANELMIDSVMVALTRLTDPPGSGQRSNLTLQRMSQALEREQGSDMRRRLDEKLGELVVTCVPMRIQRNRRIAHADLNTALQMSNELLPGVRVRDVQKALVLLENVMNIVEQAAGLPQVAYGGAIHFNTHDALLGSLIRAIAYSKHAQSGSIDPRLDDLSI